MSPDPSGSSGRALYEPQGWNRYTYALNNPIKYVDPDGRDVEIAANARSAFTYAYTHSQNFRQQFNAANMNHDIHVKLMLGKVTGARAEWRDKHVSLLERYFDIEGKIKSERWSVQGTVVIQPVGDPSTGALMGHELAHANNMAKHGLKGEGPGEEGDEQAQAVENSIRQDYLDDCDDLCRGSADEALRGAQGGRSRGKDTSGFDQLHALMAAADARIGAVRAAEQAYLSQRFREGWQVK